MLAQPWNLLGPNPNVSWYSKKRVWILYFLLIYIGRLMWSVVHVPSPLAWTLTNVIHSIITFLALHWSKGSPFPHAASKSDRLTIWEQIDKEAFFTPTKKVLTFVPIVVFVLAIHYNEYNKTEFFINSVALGFAIIPKLPLFHRVRLFGVNAD